MAIIAVPLVLAGLVAGQVIASVGGVDSAPEIARDFSTDPSEWYTAGELIGFESTPAGVRANVLLDGYRVGEVGWASSGVVVELRGPDGMGLALLNPNERRTELLATVGSWDPNASVVLYRPDSRTGVIASTRDGREFELRLATFDAAVKLQSAAVIARRVVRIAIHPDGDRICMVRREGRHGRIVEEYGLDGSNRAGTVLFASQQELAGLSYGAGGDAIVFQEETESGLETNIFYGGEGRRRLTLGDGRLSQNALNASGDRLIVIEGEEDTRGLLYDAVTGTQLTNLGGMVDAG